MKILSPSKIASYFYHECERHLVYNSLPKKEKEKYITKEFIENPFKSSLITSGGFAWEEKVITEFIQEEVLISSTENEKPITEAYLSLEEFIEALKKPTRRYIYQPTLEVPRSFYKKYNLDTEKMKFSTCRPDLIEVIFDNENNMLLKVIDIKSSEALKISHKIQTTLYGLILASFLEEHGVQGKVDLETTGIWLYEAEEPEMVSIKSIVPIIEKFLKDGLVLTVQKSFEDLSWHIDYRCEWCNIYDYCLNTAKENQHITLIPYLKNYASKFVREHNLPETLQEMEAYLQEENNKDFLCKCTSFKQRINKLDHQIQSIITDKVIAYNSFATDMPIGENIRIFLTVQRDQVTGKVFAAGIYRFGGKEVFTDGTETHYFVANKIEDCERVTKDFVDKLYDQLEIVESYNAKKDAFKDKKSVQVYVTDNYEKQNLIYILNELLLDEHYREKAIQLMFYFHTELLSEGNEQPENVIHFPVVVLTSVVSRLFAIPANIALRLEDLSNYIASHSDHSFSYEAKDYFSFKLTNVMKSDIVHQVWQGKKDERIGWIESELGRRLWLANSVVNGIRKLAKDDNGNELLFAWPEKFKMPLRLNFRKLTYSKLAFMSYYESILNYLEVRQNRSRSLQERLTDAKTLLLEYVRDNKFLLKNNLVFENLKDGGNWLLTENNYEGEKLQQSFNDYYNKQNMSGAPRNKNLYFTRILDSELRSDESVVISLDLPTMNKFDLIRGHEYLITERFMDWNTSKVINELQGLDEREDDKVIKLLESPNLYRKKFKKWWNDEYVEEVISDRSLTISQRKAFLQFLQNNLTCVWGPPGTGKTHFIASAILLLNQIYKKKGKNLRILVSGFTHAAIENVLVKLNELKQTQDDMKICKIGDVKTEKARAIDSVNEKEISTWLDQSYTTVVGATLYATHKAFNKNWLQENYDVVVLDEASQIRTGDALLALSRIKEVGRLLIVGDHYQLPPIIKGSYTVSEEEVNIYSSIFELLYNQDVENRYVCQLNENFRMNETLCRYSASEIYGSNYTAFNREIGSYLINITGLNSEEWIEKVIDPEYPLVVCVYDGFQGTQVNEIEANWVSKLTKEFRSCLLNKELKYYEDSRNGDDEFWKHGLFIISPHNAQISAIKKNLIEEGLRPEFFVGSVDKMQGQESDVAIISYGVADNELAELEGEFIYSLNRLNVSLTRAKAKTIIFLSRQLMSPTLQVFGNDEYSEGVNFMIKLEQFARDNGKLLNYQLDGTNMKIYRVGQI